MDWGMLSFCRIASVHDRFEQELDDFTQYLDVAANASKRYPNPNVHSNIIIATFSIHRTQ